MIGGSINVPELVRPLSFASGSIQRPRLPAYRESRVCEACHVQRNNAAFHSANGFRGVLVRVDATGDIVRHTARFAA